MSEFEKQRPQNYQNNKEKSLRFSKNQSLEDMINSEDEKKGSGDTSQLKTLPKMSNPDQTYDVKKI